MIARSCSQSLSALTESTDLLTLQGLDLTADLNSLHYPQLEPGQPWFKSTQSHFMIKLKLTPCARLLYEWILLKGAAGTWQTVDLKDFRAVTSEHRRGKPYSMRQIRNAVSELEDLKLLVVAKEELKALCRHPGKVINPRRSPSKKSVQPVEVNFQPVEVNFQPWKLTSTSNAASQIQQSFQIPSDLYRSTETTNIPAAHPVVVCESVLEKEELAKAESVDPLTPPPEPQTPPIDLKPENRSSQKAVGEGQSSAAPPTPAQNALLDQVEDLGIDIHPKIEQLVLEADLAIVEDALAVVKERVAKGNVRNRSGLLVDAINGQWKPSGNPDQSGSSSSSPYPPEFVEWYERAIAEGLVEDLPLNYLTTTNGEITVRIPKPNPQPGQAPYDLVPWTAAKAMSEGCETAANATDGSEATPEQCAANRQRLVQMMKMHFG